MSRAVDLVLALADGPQPLGTLAASTRLSKTTVHRILAALAHRHVVVQEQGSGRYMLGPGCYRLLRSITHGRIGLGHLASDVLARLRDDSGETVTLHVRIGRERMCIAEVPSAEPLRYTAGVGAMAPVHTGSAGKVLLAFAEDADRDVVLSDLALEPLTDRTITDRSALLEALATARRRGWAESHGERARGGAAVSAPIFDESGVLAALSVLGPEARLTRARLRELRPKVIDGALELTTRLQSPSFPSP